MAKSWRTSQRFKKSAKSWLVNWGPPSVLTLMGTPKSLKKVLKSCMVLDAVVSLPQCPTAGHPEYLSTYTRYDLPAILKKSADTDSNCLVGVSVLMKHGSHCWLGNII